MRPIKLLLLILFSAIPAQAQWTVTDAIDFSGISTGTNLTLAAINAGDGIFITVGAGSATSTITSFTLNGGTCGSALAKTVGATFPGGFDSEIWASGNCSASITSVTPAWSGGGSMNFTIYTIGGLPATPIVDATNTDSAGTSTTSQVGPAVTTTKTGDFILTQFDPLHGVTGASAGWTREAFAVGMAYLTSNSAAPGTYQITWTLSIGGGYAATTAAFKTASVSGRGPKGKIL